MMNLMKGFGGLRKRMIFLGQKYDETDEMKAGQERHNPSTSLEKHKAVNVRGGSRKWSKYGAIRHS
jgi:hypothetical protein